MKKFFLLIFSVFFLFTLPISAQSLQDIDLINLRSNYVSLARFKDGKIIHLYQKNADARMYPASMTKMINAYTAIINMKDPQEMITVLPEDLYGLEGASIAGFEAYEQYSYKDILYAILLPSGGDASNVIARHVAGSRDNYVAMMNQVAQDIGMESTHFANPIGLFDENHYSTANDLVLFLETALQNQHFKEVLSALTYTTQPTEVHPDGVYFESSLIGYSQGDPNAIGRIMGGKTGWIPESGYNLSSYSEMYGDTFVVVSGDAFEFGRQLYDHNDLYNYIFENKHVVTVLEPQQSLGQVKLIHQDNPAYYDIKVNEIVEKEIPIAFDESDLVIDSSFIEEIETPVTRGQEIGSLSVKLGDEVIYTEDFVFEEDIERNDFIYFSQQFKDYLMSQDFINTLLIIGPLIAAFIGLIFIYKKIKLKQRKNENYKGYRY